MKEFLELVLNRFRLFRLGFNCLTLIFRFWNKVVWSFTFSFVRNLLEFFNLKVFVNR